MAVSINSVDIPLPLSIIAGLVLALGLVCSYFEIKEIIRVLLSTFVTPGKPVSHFVDPPYVQNSD